jgi:hypothetical protein
MDGSNRLYRLFQEAEHYHREPKQAERVRRYSEIVNDLREREAQR